MGSFAEGRQRGWDKLLAYDERHPRTRGYPVFLIIALGVNIGVFVANIIRGHWLSAIGSALVILVVLWLAATYRARLRRVPEPPWYWPWYQRRRG